MLKSASLWAAVTLSLALSSAFAQDEEQKGPFGGFKHDNNAPIDITSDSLEVRQSEQLAIFTGNVVAGQGTLRLTAERLDVFYDEEQEGGDTGAIEKINATGNVFLSNGSETAQGAAGTYDVTTGLVTMTGDVVLTQGTNAISGPKLEIDMNTGVGRVFGGRVKSRFKPQSAQGN